MATTRATFQDERIEELALPDSAEASAVRKKIENVEATHSQNRIIQSMLGNFRGTGITQVNKVDSVNKAVKIHTHK